MKSMLLSLTGLASLGFLAALPATPGTRTDFALLDMEPGVGDVSVQCGAITGSTKKPKATPFSVDITMTNREDLGGTDGFVRVTYNDDDFVDYGIARGATVQISLQAGGTLGVDDLLTVTGEGGAILIGQLSIITAKGKPHPDLAGQDGDSYCTTTPAPAP